MDTKKLITVSEDYFEALERRSVMLENILEGSKQEDKVIVIHDHASPYHPYWHTFKVFGKGESFDEIKKSIDKITESAQTERQMRMHYEARFFESKKEIESLNYALQKAEQRNPKVIYKTFWQSVLEWFNR